MEPALDRHRASPEATLERTPEEPLWSAAGSAVKGGVSFLAELIGRISRGIMEMVPLVFAIGCQSAASDQPAPRPAPPAAVVEEAKVSVAEEPVAPPETGPRQLGHFNITFYYVVGEEEVAARPRKKPEPANDNQAAVASGKEPTSKEAGSNEAGSNEAGSNGVTGPDAGSPEPGGSDKDLAAAAPPEKVMLYGSGPDCEPIAETTREFADELAMQGTGKLRDGRVLNVWGPCNCPTSPCWKVIEQQWGTGGGGRPLQPFRTVAVDPKLIRLGSLLYIPLLEGRLMPGRAPWGGFVHDGCVVADDTGAAIRDHQLDLFVGRRGWFLGMSGHPGSHSWARHIPVFDGSKVCERKGRKISRKTGSI
ncbi:MAG TPA: 3D domain-containing protein [Kofleriaceae bacterium]|nr:3D domain-containing protein [Kofleriaceae bacterium]